MSRQPYYPPQGQQQSRQRQAPPNNGYAGPQTNIRGGHSGQDNGGSGYYQQPLNTSHDPYAGENGYNDPGYGQNEYYDDRQPRSAYQQNQDYYQQPYRQKDNSYSAQQQERRPIPPPSSRSYQYDERFHQGNGRVAQAPGPPNDRTRRSEDRHRPANLQLEKRSRSKPRERILPAEPLSPTTISWDNPFPTFNTKKTERKKHASLDKGVGKLNLGPSSPRDSRPSTSQGSRRREETRPSTSHSQKHPDSRGPASPALPQQPPNLTRWLSEPQPPPTDEAYRGGNLESKSQPPPLADAMGQSLSHVGRGPPAETSYSKMNPARQAIADAEWGKDVIPPDVHYNGGTQDYSDPNYNYQRPERPKVQTAQSQPVIPTTRSQLSNDPSGVARQRPPNMRVQTSVPESQPPNNEMPDFDLIPKSAVEREELYVTPSQPEQPAYQKKVYQAGNTSNQASAPPSQRPQQGQYISHDVQSPVDHFRFDLPQAEASPIHKGPSYPPRGASRPEPQPQSANDNRRLPYSNGPPQGRFDRGQQMSGPANINRSAQSQSQGYDNDYGRNERGQDYGNDFDSGFDQQLSNRGNQPLQTGSMNDVSRQYSQSPPQGSNFYGMPPIRPTTSGSGMSARPPPVRHYGDRNSSDTHHQQHGRKTSNSGFGNGDTLPAHPAPYRPGLMNNDYPRAETPRTEMPPPQSQRPQQSRGPPAQVTPKQNDTPVTTQELNEIQQRVKANPQDYALGLKFAKKLVQAASVLANEGGRADQKTTAKNRERYIMDAHKVVKKLVSAGYPDAMFYLADCHGQGLLGLAPDPKEAFILYQSAAKLNHAPSAYRVAVCCEIGQSEGGGTRQDPLKAMQWYKRAATLGDVPAMYKMGMILTKGLMGQSKNPREALTWLKRAADRADAENPHALHELALLYESASPSDYIIRDAGYALQLYTQAGELGYKYSQFRLGAVYEYGLLSQAIDPRASIAWYSAAAAQGEHQAELALSGWYLTGSDPILEQSDTEAYLWARKSANSGLSKAEYAMGYFTETGIGVSANLEEAKRWYWKAANHGFPKAVERMEALKAGGRAKKKERVSRSAVKDKDGDCTVM